MAEGLGLLLANRRLVGQALKMHIDANDLASLRLYTRQHLYAALRLQATLVGKSDGAASSNVATGFLLNGRVDGNQVAFLVTNRHVLDPPYVEKYRGYYLESLEIKGTIISKRGSADKSFVLRLENPAARYPQDPTLDIGMIRLEQIQLPEGGTPSALSSSDMVDRSEIARDQIGVGAGIVMTGYPEVAESVGERPLLVPGIVSSDLRYDAQYGGNTYPNRGMAHAFSRSGMSGSPVLTTVVASDAWAPLDDPGKLTRQVKLLGVNTGHVNESHGPTALSLFVSAHVLDEMLAAEGDHLAQLRMASSS